VVQETVIGVARKMPEFKYTRANVPSTGGSCTSRPAASAEPVPAASPQNVPLTVSGGPETTTETSLEPARILRQDVLETNLKKNGRKNIVDVAMERVRRRPPTGSHYQIFHLHAVNRPGVRDVAKLTGAQPAKVYVTYIASPTS